MIHQWIVEMLMCTCNWLNMKPSFYLFLDFSLGLLNLREIVGCKIVEVCHYRHKLPAVCLPSVFKELQLLKKKNQHPQYWRRAKAINVNSLTVNQLLLRWPYFTSREKLLCNDYFRYRKIFVTLRFSQTLQIFLARTCK